jgi:hypothetical protein
VLPNLTKRYKPVFARLASSRYRFDWLSINTSRHHLSPILDHGLKGSRENRRTFHEFMSDIRFQGERGLC